jgi:predicted phage tail protein
MIKVHVPTGLPTSGGKLEFCSYERDFRPGASVADYLIELAILPELVSHVIYNGGSLSPEKTVRYRTKPKGFWRRMLRLSPAKIAVLQSDLEAATPRDGDEFHVIPSVEGKNAAQILGAVSAAVVIAAGFYVGGPSGALFAAKAWGLYAYAAGSFAGSLLTPRADNIKAPGDDGPTTHTWGGLLNEDREGVPVPIVFGKNRTGIVRVGAFIRRSKGIPGYTNGVETLHILGLVSVGPVHSIGDIRVNDQPYTNFPGVTVETRLGTTGQAPLKGFSVVANTFPLSVELTPSGYTYSTRANFPVDSLEVLLTIPALFHVDEDRGEQKTNATRYRYRHRLKGGAFGAWTDVEVKRSSRSAVLETVRIENLTRGEYDVEIQFVSADHVNDQRDAWKIFLTGVTEELEDLRTYDGYAMVAVRAIAREDLNGQIPNISVLCEGLELETWNGSGFTAPAYLSGAEEIGRSPAWIILKLLRDRSVRDAVTGEYTYEAFGLGDWITDDQIDLDSFLTLADRANEAVTAKRIVKDSNGAENAEEFQEPRFLLDIVVNQEQRALELIRTLLATCRAFLVFSGNQWRVVCEMPKTPVQLFTMGNIKKGSFSIAYNADRTINALVPQFIDADRDYEFTTHEPIDGPGVTHYNQPRRSENQQFVGITRRTQVIREALYNLNKRWYIRRLIGFTAGTAGILAEAGDLIHVQHDIPQWGFGGCALASTPNGLTSSDTLVVLGREVTLEAGKTYQLVVRFQDGSHDEGESRTVADGPGTYSALYVTTPFSRPVQENDIWWFGEVSPQPCTVVEIAETDGDEDERQLLAVEYNESIENDETVVVVPQLSNLPRFLAPPPPITSGEAKEIISARNDGRWSSTIVVQWTPPTAQSGYGVYSHADVDISFDGGTSWVPAPNGQGLGSDYRITDAEHGTPYKFRITPISTRGIANRAGAFTTASLTTQGKTTAPPTPTGFVGAVEDGVFLFSWNPVAIDDLQREVEYEVRTSNPANWKTDLTGLLWRGKTIRFQIDDPTQRSYTLYLRAVDKFSNYSAGAATTTLTDTAPAAPSIISITRFKNQLKVKVGAAADSDVFAQRLHASQSTGFTPDESSIVSGIVGPNGGEFVVPITASGNWYFRLAAEDWLSDRLNDWIYSPQASSSIIVVSPVDPTAVTLTILDRPDKPMGSVRNPDNTVMPIKLKAANVGFTFSDVVNPANSLIGFDVLIYESVDGPSTPAAQHFLTNVADRAHLFLNFQPKGASTYIAAVRAVYVDGLTSNLVTHTGVVIPQETNPNFRDADDRNVTALAESFEGAGVPTGITVPIGTIITVANGLLILATTASGAKITWNLATWVAAYLDRHYALSEAVVLLRVLFSGASYNQAARPYIEKGASTYNLDPVAVDGNLHTYRLKVGGVTTSAEIISLVVPAAFMPSGSAVALSAIAVAYENFDESLDGYMDRAQRARDQFGKDPTGGGFFLQSPFRNSDDSGQITLIDGNGMTWLRTGGGAEFALKYAHKIVLSDVYDGLVLNWDTLYGSNPSVDPPVRKPSASNKARFIVEAVAPVQPNPAAYPVRRYAEITMVNDSNFQVNLMESYGGTKGSYRDVAPATPGWNVAAKKSQILKHATHSHSANDGSDGWYDFTPLSPATLPNTGAAYYRVVAWLKTTFPVQKKANGSYYWVKLLLDAWASAPVAASNPLTLSSAGLANLQLTFKGVTDGTEARMPVVFAASTLGAMQSYAHALKFDWWSTVLESGAPGGAEPSAVYLDAVEVYWMNSAAYSPVTSTQGYNINLIAGEAF